MTFFNRYRHRFDDIISGAVDPRDGGTRPHIRFDGESLTTRSGTSFGSRPRCGERPADSHQPTSCHAGREGWCIGGGIAVSTIDDNSSFASRSAGFS
jgi:hypothetical protein